MATTASQLQPSSRFSVRPGRMRSLDNIVPTTTSRQKASTSTQNTEAPKRLGVATVRLALEELKRGRPVVVTDDADRENEGDLILAAELATKESMAFMVRHTSGVICVALNGDRLDELELGPMIENNQDPKGTAFTVSVDLKGRGITTGISASDRAATLAALADTSMGPHDFCRPGHIFPLRARPGGVLERGGHTEAAVDLAKLAGLYPAGVLCEIVRDSDGEMARADDLDAFRREHNLVMTTIEDIRAYRKLAENNEEIIDDLDDTNATKESKIKSSEQDQGLPTNKPIKLEFGPSSRLPTRYGQFRMICFTQPEDGIEHMALIHGMDDAVFDTTVKNLPFSNGKNEMTKESPSKLAPLVRVHSECATGDLFASRRCDCGEQLERALKKIAAEPYGVLLYIRGHEGRGIGLGHKLSAYALQDQGLDTVEANVEQGLPIDARSYSAAAAMLHLIGIDRIRLMTNNPAKCVALRELGIEIPERIPLVTVPNSENLKYLLTKQKKMGHLLNLTTPLESSDILPLDSQSSSLDTM